MKAQVYICQMFTAHSAMCRGRDEMPDQVGHDGVGVGDDRKGSGMTEWGSGMTGRDRAGRSGLGQDRKGLGRIVNCVFLTNNCRVLTRIPDKLPIFATNPNK